MNIPVQAMRDWLSSATAQERQRVAESSSISVGYLWLLAGGHRRPSEMVAAAIHRATSGAVPAISFFPKLAELLDDGREVANAVSSPAVDENLSNCYEGHKSADDAGILSSAGGAK